jgi:hypothetical protein
MSSSALRIDEHLAWISCYLECWNCVAALAAAGDLPRFSHTSRLAALSINISADIAGHLSAVTRALPPAARELQAPWELVAEPVRPSADMGASAVPQGERPVRRTTQGSKS